MKRVVFQFLLVLLAFAFIGGASAQLARAAKYAAPMGVPCDMTMMSHARMPDGQPMAPCKSMTPDCIKLMGCVTDAGLPARVVSLDAALHFSDIDYWSAWSTVADFVREPEPLPPRTI